jgi:hypothetical protein
VVFKKGQSGNPTGLPQKPETIEKRRIAKDIRDLCRSHTLDAVNALIDVLNSKSSPPAARVAAANSILDRGWGKAQIEVNATVTAYDKMSDIELVKLITGNVIEGEVLKIIEEAESDESYADELLEDDEE